MTLIYVVVITLRDLIPVYTVLQRYSHNRYVTALRFGPPDCCATISTFIVVLYSPFDYRCVAVVGVGSAFCWLFGCGTAFPFDLPLRCPTAWPVTVDAVIYPLPRPYVYRLLHIYMAPTLHLTLFGHTHIYGLVPLPACGLRLPTLLRVRVPVGLLPLLALHARLTTPTGLPVVGFTVYHTLFDYATHFTGWLYSSLFVDVYLYLYPIADPCCTVGITYPITFDSPSCCYRSHYRPFPTFRYWTLVPFVWVVIAVGYAVYSQFATRSAFVV